MATLKELIGEGYNENLSHAEIDALLKDKKIADLSTGNYMSIGKHNAEMKSVEEERDDYKNKYLAKCTDEEKREEEIAKKEAYYKKIERENSVNKYAKTLSYVTDEKARLELAELYADGKNEEALNKLAEYQANNEAQLRETIKQELLSSNPTPPPVNNTGTTTKEQFAQMGYQEKVKLYNENPDLYNQLNS